MRTLVAVLETHSHVLMSPFSIRKYEICENKYDGAWEILNTRKSRIKTPGIQTSLRTT